MTGDVARSISTELQYRGISNQRVKCRLNSDSDLRKSVNPRSTSHAPPKKLDDGLIGYSLDRDGLSEIGLDSTSYRLNSPLANNRSIGIGHYKSQKPQEASLIPTGSYATNIRSVKKGGLMGGRQPNIALHTASSPQVYSG
jgi:hypothetical protein